jgi:hypothetical protein
MEKRFREGGSTYHTQAALEIKVLSSAQLLQRQLHAGGAHLGEGL